jgi:glycosyltransferase involved in cell wall biosynthesis
MDVSVVVCTYNRAELLARCLASLAGLRSGDRFQYEVVVVDNGSTDDTPRVIAEAACARGFREERPGVAAARNCGVRNARGRWIAFVDDDEIVDPDWLDELLAAARRTGARCVAGAIRLQLPDDVLRGLPPACRRLLGESLPSERLQRRGRQRGLASGNLLMDRAVLEELGGFDESLCEAGEDADLSRRVFAAGVRVAFAPSAVTWHFVPAYRLGEAYFRWTSLRHGMHVARRERQAWGRLGFPAALAARLAQAALEGLPCWLWGAAARSRGPRLDGLCRLWRTEGYLRFALFSAAPRWFAQRGFRARVDFRAERELFANGCAGNL